jgi:hypothetical protein
LRHRDLRAARARIAGVRVRVRQAGLVVAAAYAALAAGCGTTSKPVGRLPGSAFPYLGIACGVANWAGCDRIRIGVHLGRPANHVTVRVDGRLVTLSPPTGPGDDLWQGTLLGAGPRHGPLAVRSRHGYWYGEPPVHPHLRVTAYFADGTTATRAAAGYLHAGYG